MRYFYHYGFDYFIRMLRRIIVFISFYTFFNYPVFSQYGTTEGLILFTGEIVAEDGVTVLPDVHLLNRNNGQVIVSDPSGFFSIYVSKVHVLRFTSVGYEPFYFSIPGGFNGEVLYQQIVLRRRVTPLENITIYGKREVTESILSVKKEPNPLEGVQYGTLQGEQHEVAPSAVNIASLLWEWWSREGKEKKKLKEILMRKEISDKVSDRFESDLIWELTGLIGDELDKFKRFCNLPPGFVLTSNDYDFLTAVKSCYYTYKKQ